VSAPCRPALFDGVLVELGLRAPDTKRSAERRLLPHPPSVIGGLGSDSSAAQTEPLRASRTEESDVPYRVRPVAFLPMAYVRESAQDRNVTGRAK
jgi:hypothetical protein